MAVRAKVVCTERSTRAVYDGEAKHEREVTSEGKCYRAFAFVGVYSQDPNHENKAFAEATPSLSVTMVVENAQVDFEPGKEYYLDFVRAPDTLPYAGPKFKRQDRVICIDPTSEVNGVKGVVQHVHDLGAGSRYYDVSFDNGMMGLATSESALAKL